ncbi:MAG: hypothetical protein ACLP19_27230 [Xanthobacteraceae bacterium]
MTKTKFAELSGVSQARVSQWLRKRKIYGDAIVGEGRDTRINVDIAREQLKRTLDLNQRLGANGKVKFDDDPDTADSVEDDIKRARLEQLELSNEHARALRELQAGRYTRTDGVQQEMGRIAGRMVSMFEGSLDELATAVAAKSNLSSRDALHILRTTFHEIRERAANTESGIAKALPALVDDDSGSCS